MLRYLIQIGPLIGLLTSLTLQAKCYIKNDLIREINENVFQIIPINLFAENISVKKAREIYESQCDGKMSVFSQSDKMNCEIYKSCKSQETCLAEYAPHGTAFAIDGGDKLMTAWHVSFGSHAAPMLFLHNAFNNYSVEERNNKLFENLEPAFVLLNQDKKVVFDTRQEIKSSSKYIRWGDPFSTVYSHYGMKKNKPYGYFENLPDDYVVIKLPRRISKGLEYITADKNSLNKDECYFSAGYGYNGKKEEYRITGGRSSSLKDLKKHLRRFTSFMLNPLPLPLNEFESMDVRAKMSNMGYSDDSIDYQLEKYDEKVIEQSIESILHSQSRHMRDLELDSNSKALFFRGDILGGQSGGPILNSFGQVIGVTTNGFIENDGTSIGGAGVLVDY